MHIIDKQNNRTVTDKFYKKAVHRIENKLPLRGRVKIFGIPSSPAASLSKYVTVFTNRWTKQLACPAENVRNLSYSFNFYPEPAILQVRCGNHKEILRRDQLLRRRRIKTGMMIIELNI
jgi:hypothetical protein